MSDGGWARKVWDRAGMILVLVFVWVCAAFFVKDFLTSTNLILSLGLSVVTTGIVACGMLFCLAGGDFDLSVGSLAAFAGMLAAVLMAKHWNAPEAVLVALGVCALIGLFNGFIIAVCGINALITTLATMQIVRGTGYLLNDGNSLIAGNEGFVALGNGHWLGVPLPIWTLLGCFALFGVLLHRTVYGRHTLAIGGNREAARLAGVPTNRVKMTIFAVQAALAGLAGIVSSAQQQLGDPKGMQGLELKVISACVLGGVSMTGGIGSIHHVIVGVLIMGTVQNIMDLCRVGTFYQYLVSGIILLAAVLLDRLKRR